MIPRENPLEVTRIQGVCSGRSSAGNVVMRSCESTPPVFKAVSTARASLRGLLIVVLAFGACCSTTLLAQAPALPLVAFEKSVQNLVERNQGAIVSIARVRPSATEMIVGPDQRVTRLDPLDPDFVPNEFASGILIRGANPQEPVVLTCYHAVRNGQRYGQPVKGDQSRLFVTFAGRKGCWATVFAADPRSDLAVLALDSGALRSGDMNLTPLELGRADEMTKGQFVLLLGNPYAIARDGSASVTMGMISNMTRRPPPDPLVARDDSRKAKPTIHYFGTLWQVDARLSLGMSGAAAINLNGELVGMGSSLAALDGYEKSSGFVVPFDAGVRRIVESLIRGEEVEYGFLGVSLNRAPVVIPRAIEGYPRVLYGTQVEMAYPYSPAWNGRIEPGDIVLEIGGVRILQGDDLMREVGLKAPGTVVPFKVLRGQQELQLSVRLGKWPVDWEDQIVASGARRSALRGLTVDYSTGRWKLLPQPIRFLPGVLVTEIVAESAGSRAGLHVGDFITEVNGQPVGTPAEFTTLVTAAAGKLKLTLADGRQVTVEAE
ncbi:hypothetical protein A6X21_15610 [Planctopirus hydrillae]|uniref:PDZ domain-containing protein n=2 Tax=Planctopirus hydrillae TaxID=1841610 RepID=A0A1C3ETP9_9PLAN|nr:hypothetical protein A6X21_15610 [Planctopirus hydrillae]